MQSPIKNHTWSILMSLPTNAELRSLMDLCIEKGVMHLSIGNIQFGFHESAFKSVEPAVKIEPTQEIERMPSDDEMLFHSTELMPAPTPENN